MSESYLKTLAEEISNFLSSETVIGEPIVQEDKVLIPVTKLGFAIGSGSGKGTGREGGGEGLGGGGGGGVEPVALIAVFKNVPGPEGVQALHVCPGHSPASHSPRACIAVSAGRIRLYEQPGLDTSSAGCG